MALRTLITERQRRLGAELRKLRMQAGLSVAEGGQLIDMGAPHLSHIEAGRTAIPAPRLRELAQAYDCNDEPYINELVRMAESKGKGWWSEYRKIRPQSSLDLAELEAAATSIRSHETLLVPGLLQTESYMRALFSTGLPEASRDERETAVRYRLARQTVLDEPHITSFHAVLHEAALHVVVGDSRVMREQLSHLVRIATRPNVTIQVLPFDAGPGSWRSAPFLQLAPDVASLGSVILEHPAARLVLDDEASLNQYRATFEELRHSALPPIVPSEFPAVHEHRDSWGLMQHLLYTHQE
ncbi:transcriptional regulator with XRE-family HTH domain [Streptomyces umbrinus]|uniref:Transcriptional regulator with XRE-family HTH domain n=1 Tax=Streptomyces umbrinus TaxID=67370 RepID=A0ABU0SXU5_9ACTN|nr:helix-turn-helix transcriptional regulator [Streptomyces umbrinus]MDQ1028375.1 transcriptional regulator with XRE-family HTH domain [Streptomyces umbrinus]